MLAKDSVQVRLERGLSFTEFSYMLLQAYDYAHMYRTMGVELQMGGADQWGNITAGLELIRRTERPGATDAEPAHGLAYKLLLSPSGTKFGKSEVGRVGLARPGADVALRVLPVLAERGRPRHRHVPALVHRAPARADRGARGRDAPRARRRGPRSARWPSTSRPGRTATRRRPARSPIPRRCSRPSRSPIRRCSRRCTASAGGFEFDPAWLAAGAAVLLAEAGVFASRGEARRMIAGGGVTINGVRVTDADDRPEPIAGEWLDVRIGKRRREIGRQRR